MSRFTTALTTWFGMHKSVSLRTIADEAGVNHGLMSMWRAGKRPITFGALGKLLPAIERHSNRTEALTLHVAYLLDEIVTGYEADLSVTAIDSTTKIQRTDIIQERASRWIKKARTDSEFEVMWNSLDGYMAGREELIKDLAIDVLANEEDAKRRGTAFPELASPSNSRLNEDPPKPGGAQPEPEPQQPTSYKEAMKNRNKALPNQEE